MAAAVAISGAPVAKQLRGSVGIPHVPSRGSAKSEDRCDNNPFSHKNIDLDLGTEARLENEEVVLDQIMERRVDRHWQARCVRHGGMSYVFALMRRSGIDIQTRCD